MDKIKIVEPVSRKLILLGKLYLSELVKNIGHLDISRYYYVLTLITYHDGELTQKALGEMLGKDKSSIVSILDVLSEEGFVCREINPADRRQHFLSVTEKAKKAVPEIVQAFEQMNKNIVGNISADEMLIFNNVLHKMQENLTNFQTHP